MTKENYSFIPANISTQYHSSSIIDHPEQQCIEFYPAGFSKPTSQNKSRQLLHSWLWDITVNNMVTGVKYPFGKDTHNIILVPEPTNKYDPYAIKVEFRALNTTNGVRVFNTSQHNYNTFFELGYVPRSISKTFSKHLDTITSGEILCVEDKVYGELYRTKVIFHYTVPEIVTLPLLDLNYRDRLNGMLKEIND